MLSQSIAGPQVEFEGGLTSQLVSIFNILERFLPSPFWITMQEGNLKNPPLLNVDPCKLHFRLVKRDRSQVYLRR